MHPALFKIVNHLLDATHNRHETNMYMTPAKSRKVSRSFALADSFSLFFIVARITLRFTGNTHAHTLRNLLSTIRSDDRVPRVDKRNYQEAFHCLVASILQKIALKAKLRRQLSVHFCHRKSPNHLPV